MDRLAKFDTPTICNAIELFDVRPRNTGYMDGSVQCNFPEFPPVVGFAVTASFRSSAPPASGDAYDAMDEQVKLFEAQPGPAVVVIQDLDEPPVAAVFGEIMCTTYKAFGAAGLVTNGAGRDLDQVRDIGFPVFTGSTICSHAYCHLLDVGKPVHVGGLDVMTGELMHGDINGVTSIPLDIATEVAEVARQVVDAEKNLLDYLSTPGEKSPDKVATLRNELKDALTQISQDIGGK